MPIVFIAHTVFFCSSMLDTIHLRRAPHMLLLLGPRHSDQSIHEICVSLAAFFVWVRSTLLYGRVGQCLTVLLFVSDWVKCRRVTIVSLVSYSEGVTSRDKPIWRSVLLVLRTLLNRAPRCGITLLPRRKSFVNCARTTDRDGARYRYSGIRRVRQLALGCESNWVKSPHDSYENTWKCGELKLYFSTPSAGGWKKKKKKSWTVVVGLVHCALTRIVQITTWIVWVIWIYTEGLG